MTETRFQEIERLIEDTGRCFDPVTGVFESVADDEEDCDHDLDTNSFLGVLGITEDECAEYVQRKMREYGDSLRDA